LIEVVDPIEILAGSEIQQAAAVNHQAIEDSLQSPGELVVFDDAAQELAALREGVLRGKELDPLPDAEKP